MSEFGPAGGSTANPALTLQLNRFEEAWQRGTPPDLAAYLPAVGDPGRRILLLELIPIDL